MSTKQLAELNRAMKENLLVSIYTNQWKPDYFSTGFVNAISDQEVVLNHVTPDGLYDGYIVRKLGDLFRVDIGGLYEQRLYLLYTLQKQSHLKLIKKRKTGDANLFREVLLSARKQNYVVSLCIDEAETQNGITGWISEVFDNEVVIAKISYEGDNDGFSIVPMNRISKINCNTTDERVIKILSNYYNMEKVMSHNNEGEE